MSLRIIATGALCGLLGACALSTSAGQVASLQSAYIAAASAESVYISSGQAKPAVIAQLEQYRLPAYNAIEPLVKAEEAGTSPVTAAEIEAAQVALSALTTYEAAHAVTPKAGS